MAFQGHLSFLSNFYLCVLKDSSATSAEQLFAIRMAIYNEASRDSVQRVRDQDALTQITRTIKKSKQWGKDAPGILAEIVELKFDTCPSLREKLLNCEGDHFYEATFDKTYGCGVALNGAEKLTRDQLMPNCNVMGTILEEFRDKLRHTKVIST